MARIRPGRYEQNGVGFDVRERGEDTYIEITGEEFVYNANGFYIDPAEELNPKPKAGAVEGPESEEI